MENIELALSLGTNVALAGGIAIYAARHLIADGYVASRDAAYAAKNEIDKQVKDLGFAAADTWRGGCRWCDEVREAAAKWVGGQIDRLPHRRIQALAAELAALKQSAIDAEGLSDRIAVIEGLLDDRKPVGVARAMEYGDLDAIPVLEPVAEAPADEVAEQEPAPVAAEQDRPVVVKIAAKLLRLVLRGGQSDSVILSVRSNTATLLRDADVTVAAHRGLVRGKVTVRFPVLIAKQLSAGDGVIEVKYERDQGLTMNGQPVEHEVIDSHPASISAICEAADDDWEPDYEVLARLKDHAARYDVRYFLNGVRVLADDEGGYRMVASDGHRLIVSPRIADEAAFDCLIPRREILNARGKGWLRVKDGETGQRVTTLSADTMKATVVYPEMGQYPDVDRLIPAATVHLGRLTKSMIPEVKALGKGDFEFEGMSFQAKYILDALKALGDCDAATDDRGGIVRLTNAEGYVAIVMPRRV